MNPDFISLSCFGGSAGNCLLLIKSLVLRIPTNQGIIAAAILYTETVFNKFMSINLRKGAVTMESRSESAPGAELTESKNFFSRLAGVYFSPREAFREIGLSPKVLVPIIAMLVIGTLAGLYLSRNLDMESMMAGRMEEAVAAGKMTQEQMEQQLALVSKFASTQVIVFAALGSLAVALIIAAGFKLISSLIGAENRFKSVFAVTIYAMIAVSIIQYALIVLILSLKGSGGVDISNINSLVASNLGAVFAGILGEDALPKFFMRLAGYVDLFAIWIIALLAIGYSAVSRKLKTSTAAIWIAGVYAVIAVIGAAASSMFG